MELNGLDVYDAFRVLYHRGDLSEEAFEVFLYLRELQFKRVKLKNIKFKINAFTGLEQNKEIYWERI